MGALAKKQPAFSRTQIIKVVLVCIQKYLKENWENFYLIQKKEEEKQHISDSWEQKMRNRINNRINEIEVEQLLQNKKFTLNLNEFMSKLGLPGEVCTFASKVA